MTKYLLSFVFASIYFANTYSQSLATHIVQRGETLELISKRYNLSIQDITDVNTDLGTLYVGLTLQIPVPEKVAETIVKNDILCSDGNIETAKTFMRTGKYKKAIKQCNLAIKQNPRVDAYYIRGKSYYYREKYKSAIEDFNKVLQTSGISSEMRSECEDLREKATECRDIQIAERSKNIVELIGMGIAVTSSVMEAKKSIVGNKVNASSAGSSGGATVIDDEPNGSLGTITSSTTTKSHNRCGVCAGKGNTVEYRATFGVNNEVYCSECGKNVTSSHYHRTCTYCNGKGYR